MQEYAKRLLPETEALEVLNDITVDGICEALINGRSPKAICQELNIRTIHFWQWIRNDPANFIKYEQSLSMLGMNMRHDALLTARTAVGGPAEIAKAKMVSDVQMQIAKHYDPARKATVGQKTRVVHNHMAEAKRIERVMGKMEDDSEDFHKIVTDSRGHKADPDAPQ